MKLDEIVAVINQRCCHKCPDREMPCSLCIGNKKSKQAIIDWAKERAVKMKKAKSKVMTVKNLIR